jgi:hypothetical protein
MTMRSPLAQLIVRHLRTNQGAVIHSRSRPLASSGPSTHLRKGAMAPKRGIERLGFAEHREALVEAQDPSLSSTTSRAADVMIIFGDSTCMFHSL